MTILDASEALLLLDIRWPTSLLGLEGVVEENPVGEGDVGTHVLLWPAFISGVD
jgi:hypothetical protein